ncbi:hypothetical protein [Nocardia brasiliensis]|uniref:hypothetical protein n=1 Tax=Nocardia brasiliensis TaxID=37326 RepID=UPI00245871FB|nr:hypothetical protein [Nocardia brasiliensis]
MAVLEGNIGLTRDMDTNEHYVQLARIDLRGAKIEILDDADTISYLDFQGAIARTDALGVHLGPAAFRDVQALVRTLAQENVHVRQYAEGWINSVTRALEDGAYAAEDRLVDTWRRGGQATGATIKSIDIHTRPGKTILPDAGLQLEYELNEIRRSSAQLANAIAAVRGRSDGHGVLVEVNVDSDITTMQIASAAMQWSSNPLSTVLIDCHRKARTEAKARVERILAKAQYSLTAM